MALTSRQKKFLERVTEVIKDVPAADPSAVMIAFAVLEVAEAIDSAELQTRRIADNLDVMIEQGIPLNTP